MKKPTAAQTYETLYLRMQEIVAQLEAGSLPLDTSLALYAEGTQLAAACQRLLDSAELRIQELRIDGITTIEE